MTKQPFQAGKIDWSKREIYPLPPPHSPIVRAKLWISGVRFFTFLYHLNRKKQHKRVGLVRKRKDCEGRKELAHTMVRLQLVLFSEGTGAFFVPNIWWISPRTYYTDLFPHWRNTWRDTYNEYTIFK